VLDFARNIREPFILAFSTSSSSATMPVTLKTAEEKLKVNPTVARMVVPVGATINLDGTAAYQSVVIIFLAQFFGIDLSMFQIISLVSISVLASIGAPGVPGGSLAILIGILASFGIPNEGFALILAVDRILDMCRTSVNVTGDLVTTTVMQKFSGSKPAP
jgi:Na+/H+-dicarboxylate symporter